MELLSNSLAAYAHIRGEGGPRGAWAHPCPSEAPLPFPPHLPAPSSPSLTDRWRLPNVFQIRRTALDPQTSETGVLPQWNNSHPPGRQGSSMTSAF